MFYSKAETWIQILLQINQRQVLLQETRGVEGILERGATALMESHQTTDGGPKSMTVIHQKTARDTVALIALVRHQIGTGETDPPTKLLNAKAEVSP